MSHYQKNKLNPVTTFGDAIKSHIEVLTEEYEAYEAKRQFIQNDLRQVKDWRTRWYMYFCVTPYCKEGLDLVPGEFSATVFSFEEGVLGQLSGIIDPGYVPFGETGEVTITCKEQALPFPGKFEGSDFPVDKKFTPAGFMSEITRLAETYNTKVGTDIMLFTTRADGPVVTSCLKWLKKKTESEQVFTVLRLEMLLMEMSRMGFNARAGRKSGVIQHEGGAAKFIFKTQYDFCLPLGCEWHRQEDNEGKVDKCAQSLSLRRVYNCLHYLSHLYRTNLPRHTHKP